MNQQVSVGFLTVKICRYAICYVVNATAYLGGRDHVNQGARWVRYRDFDGTAPQRFQSKETSRFDSIQNENRALGIHARFCETSSCEDENLVKELLGQFPMMGCRPAANVAWIEEGWCEYPWIWEHLLATGEFERDGNVESMSDPA